MNLGQKSTEAPPVAGAKRPQPPQLANAKRKPRDPALPPLTDRQKIVLGQVRSAGRVCKLLAAQLAEGKDISPEAAVACSTLAAEYMGG